jgi:hypothetical protein
VTPKVILLKVKYNYLNYCSLTNGYKEELEKKKEVRKVEREQKKKETLLIKARELKAKGMDWRVMERALNLSRYPEIKEEIRKLLGF